MYKHVSELPARCAILVPHSGNFVLYSVSKSVSVSELTRRVCDFESKPFIDGQGSVTPSFNPFLSYYALAQDAESGGLAPEKADVLTCPGI